MVPSTKLHTLYIAVTLYTVVSHYIKLPMPNLPSAYIFSALQNNSEFSIIHIYNVSCMSVSHQATSDLRLAVRFHDKRTQLMNMHKVYKLQITAVRTSI